MRLIQIPVADRPECVSALNTAFAVAKRINANVKGIHIRAHRDMPPEVPVRTSWRQSWVDTVNWVDSSDEESVERGVSAAALFEKLATANGYVIDNRPRNDDQPVAVWKERIGTPSHIMPIVGPTADMMVVSRPARRGGLKANTFVMQALMTSHRPVLVVPHDPHGSIANHIAIAWNGSAEATHVVHNSLPVLKAAGAVTLITVGHAATNGPSVDQMVNFLEHHGIQAKKHSVHSGNAEEELEKACDAIGADLLAMGAYSRHRISERVFGGVSQHMIFHTDRPVLLMHH